MENHNKRSPWKWVLFYIVVGVLAYAAVYYFFFYKKGGYSYAPQSYQTQTQSQNSEIAGWKTYKNNEFGFEMQYPADLEFGQDRLKCPVDYCGSFSHSRTGSDNRVFIFSLDVANRNLYEGNDNPFFNIKDYQEVLIDGHKALYKESKSEFYLDNGYLLHEIDKDYIIFKDGRTYEFVINIDDNNKGDNAKLDKMISTFKFTIN